MRVLLAAILAAAFVAAPLPGPAQMITDHSDDLIDQALSRCPGAEDANREANYQSAAGPFLRAAKIMGRCATRERGLISAALYLEAIASVAEGVLTHNPDATTASAATKAAHTWLKIALPLTKDQSDLRIVLQKYEDELP